MWLASSIGCSSSLSESSPPYEATRPLAGGGAGLFIPAAYQTS